MSNAPPNVKIRFKFWLMNSRNIIKIKLMRMCYEPKITCILTSLWAQKRVLLRTIQLKSMKAQLMRIATVQRLIGVLNSIIRQGNLLFVTLRISFTPIWIDPKPNSDLMMLKKILKSFGWSAKSSQIHVQLKICLFKSKGKNSISSIKISTLNSNKAWPNTMISSQVIIVKSELTHKFLRATAKVTKKLKCSENKSADKLRKMKR